MEPSTLAVCTALFIGRPAPTSSVAAALQQRELESLRPPAPVPAPTYDAQSYPDRHTVSFEVVRVLRGGALRYGDSGASVAFPLTARSLGTSLAVVPTPGWGVQVDEVLAQPYAVVCAYNIFVDRGNHPRMPWHDLGTDPSLPLRGFSTLAEAEVWAEALLTTP